jgi:predicted O-methyltransferase YrrM
MGDNQETPMGLGLGLRSKALRVREELRFFTKNNFRRPNVFDLSTSERVGVVYNEPSDMCPTDRLMLYALVRGLRPQLALEIGSRWGGSARIITNAMEENGIGKLAGIDPMTSQFRAKHSDLHGRYILIEGYSPKAIHLAVEKLGGKLDFVFVDGLHIYDAARADFEGCIPHLAPGAHILFHDTFHQGIDRAVRDVIGADERFVDCGFITRNPVVKMPVSGQGLRLVRFGAVDSEALIRDSYQRSGLSAPPFSETFNNHDPVLTPSQIKATQAGSESHSPVVVL